MSLGIRIRSSSEVFSVNCEGSLVQPNDIIIPPAIVDLVSPGGAVVGWIHITDSEKSPGEWAVLNPYRANGKRLPQEIVELGKMRALKAFKNLSALRETFVRD